MFTQFSDRFKCGHKCHRSLLSDVISPHITATGRERLGRLITKKFSVVVELLEKLTVIINPSYLRQNLSIVESSCHLSTAATHGGGFTLSLLILNVKREGCEYQFFKYLV